jgi:hypothetical protein
MSKLCPHVLWTRRSWKGSQKKVKNVSYAWNHFAKERCCALYHACIDFMWAASIVGLRSREVARFVSIAWEKRILMLDHERMCMIV